MITKYLTKKELEEIYERNNPHLKIFYDEIDKIPCTYDGRIKELHTNNGQIMPISGKDFLFYAGEKFYFSSRRRSKCIHAVRWYKGKVIYLHREIWEQRMKNIIPGGFVIDHINLIGHYNYRENLRLLTESESRYHTTLSIVNTSGSKGTNEEFDRHKKWRMYFNFNGENITERFYSEEEAIQARLIVERKHLPYYLQREYYIKHELRIQKLRELKCNLE
jgi:HNH endonuclease